MIDLVILLPEPLLLGLFAVILALLIVVLPRLIHRIPLFAPNEHNTDFVIRVQNPLFTMTSLVLAFTMVQADINFRQVHALVSAEAAQINQLDRLLARYGDSLASEIRPLLHAYASSIVMDDWPAMLRHRGSEATRRAYTPISRHVLAMTPATGRQSLIFAEILKTLDQVAESRASRLSAVSVGLPAIYWEVMIFAVAMLVLVSSTIDQTPFRTAVLTAQMAVLGVFVGFVVDMDQPFKGPTSMKPDALVEVIAIMKSRTE